MRDAIRSLISKAMSCGVIAMIAVSGAGGAVQAAELQKVTMGLAAGSIEPAHIDFAIPEILGYYKAEGLSVTLVPVGSYATSFATMNSGRLDFSLSTASFELPYLAKGNTLPDTSFFESIYPFRYLVAVNPNSSIKSIKDLKGKRIGDSGFGLATHTVARNVITAAGLDPDKDVSWLNVGNGVTGGVALQRGAIDALIYGDNGMGQVEAAGIPLRYLPLPSSVPKIGGLYLATTKDNFAKRRQMVIGFGRAIAKAHLFMQTNPEAAAYLYGKMFPEALPQGKALKDQIKAVLVPLKKRMPYYTPYDPKTPYPGYFSEAEWQAEIKFFNLQGAKLPLFAAVHTNELVREINNFDHQKVINEAKNFKLPY